MGAEARHSSTQTWTHVRDYYEVSIKPEWQEAERLRDFAGMWVYALMNDRSLRESVSLVTAELMENALRHGAKTQRAIDYKLDVDQGVVRISVTNQSPPAGGDVERLEERINWLADLGDPAKAYQELLKRICDGKAVGLGLSRIVYEGGCRLSFARKADGSSVRVEAVLLAGR